LYKRKNTASYFLLTLLALLMSSALFAQVKKPIIENASKKKKVKLIHTDELLFERDVVDAQRLLGNVHLEYEGTQFYCDSAYLYSNDDFDAFSNIRILEPGGYQGTGDFLHFDRAKQTATMRDHVVMRDRDMTLNTDNLTYHLETEVANYYSGGKITSLANKNTLTSRTGSYHSKTEMFYFRDDVVLKNPDYTVECDTMQYNDLTEVTLFFGPTTITGDDTKIYCENGYYNTKKDQSRFGKNAVITSETTTLKGDSMYYDGKLGIGEVFRNVEIQDTTDNYIISGDYGKHFEKTEMSFVTGRALMTQVFDDDSLFMHADTLRSVSDTSGKDVVYAYKIK
jgi:lipopolysaccharide export system protein LptA